MTIALAGRAQGIVDVAPPEVPASVGLGVFKNGWAMVKKGDGDIDYVDTAGTPLHIYNPNDVFFGTPLAIETHQNERQENPELLPKQVVIFEKGGLRGVVDATGEVLIPAAYNHIDIEYRQFWKLHKGSKISYYLPGGDTLPFFDDIGYLDGEHFDVRQGSNWHIYRKSSGNIITKTAYEGFDYCGGCGSASPYVYARKAGKWGIIDWDENVLVPFVYDHEHRGMRSDNWVASFSKDGKPVIIHIPTLQEFAAGGTDTELMSGMLITTQQGKYGAYNSDGQLHVPFEYDNVDVPNPNSYLGYYGDYLVVEKDRRKGVVRSDGTVVVPLEYEEVMVYDDYFVVTSAGRTALLAAGEAEPLIQIEHGDITHIRRYFYSSGSGGLAVFRVKRQAYVGLYFADSGKYYEPEFYDVSLSEAGDVEGGQVIVADNQGQKKLFSLTGERLLPFEVADFKVFDELEEPLLSVNVDGKWGLYDIGRKKEIVPPKYDRFFKVLGDSAARFIRGTVEETNQPDQYELYHTDGTKAIDQVFSTIESIDGRHYLIGMGDEGAGGYAVFDGETGTLEPLDYRFVSVSDSPRLLVVSEDQLTGKLYDVGTKKALGRDYWIFMFSGAKPTEEALKAAPARWGLSHFTNGLARVATNDGEGFIDEREQVVIEPCYAQARLVGERYAMVRESAGGGMVEPAYFINRASGKRIFPKAYFVDDVLLYNVDDYELDGVAILVKQEEDPERYYGYRQFFGLGDLKTGKMLAGAVYDEIRPLYHNPYLVLAQTVGTEDGERGTKKYGLATKDGRILFEPRFDDIYYDDYSSTDMFPLLVREGDTWKYINADGSYLPITGDYALR